MGYIPRSFTQLASELHVPVNTVKPVWYTYCDEMQTLAKPKRGLISEKLQEDNLELIEVLKVHSPLPSQRGVKSSLEHNKSQCRPFCGP